MGKELPDLLLVDMIQERVARSGVSIIKEFRAGFRIIKKFINVFNFIRSYAIYNIRMEMQS